MNYDSFATTFSNSRKNLSWPELDAIIEDMRKNKTTNVFDIGCGNGRFIEQLEIHKLGIMNYLGIDNSEKMIEEARKLHSGYDFQVAPMESLLAFQPAHQPLFQAILFLASFHHLDTKEKRLETLKAAKRYLTPNGQIYMTNWNLREQIRYQDSHRGNGDFDIKIGEYSRYYHGFTVEELKELFHETGYTIIENRIFDGGRNLFSVLVS